MRSLNRQIILALVSLGDDIFTAIRQLSDRTGNRKKVWIDFNFMALCVQVWICARDRAE